MFYSRARLRQCIQVNWLRHGELKQQNEECLLLSALYFVFNLSVN